MNTVHIIILVLAVVIVILAIVMITHRTKGEFYAIGDAKDSVCKQYIADQCKAEQAAFLDPSHPYESQNTWNVLQACINKATNECICKNEQEIRKKCFDSYKHSEEWNSRVLGCYRPTLSESDQTACFADPYKFLCKDPKSEACEDFTSLCDVECTANNK